MAKKLTVGKLSDEAILRVARVRATQSAAGAFTEVSFDTQLSVERGVIWMIHFIEFAWAGVVGLSQVAANAAEIYQAQVTRESKAAIVAGNDSDLIQGHQMQAARSAAIGTDAGPLWLTQDLIRRFDYPVPLPYASQSVFVGIDTTNAVVETVDLRIGYTIREVDDQFFFRVASALLG